MAGSDERRRHALLYVQKLSKVFAVSRELDDVAARTAALEAAGRRAFQGQRRHPVLRAFADHRGRHLRRSRIGLVELGVYTFAELTPAPGGGPAAGAATEPLGGLAAFAPLPATRAFARGASFAGSTGFRGAAAAGRRS